jgi:DNA-binding transcriptional MocR family regulator
MMNEGTYRGAARTSLAEEAYEAIRGMILDGRLVPGSRVTVRPIASALDLSPTPIKAALVRLEREGVLESRLNRGFFVPTLRVWTAWPFAVLRNLPSGQKSRPCCGEVANGSRHACRRVTSTATAPKTSNFTRRYGRFRATTVSGEPAKACRTK